MKKIEKIIQYIESKGIAFSNFEKKAGLSNGYIANSAKSNSEPSSKMLEKMIAAFPDLEKNLESHFTVGDKVVSLKSEVTPGDYLTYRRHQKQAQEIYYAPFIPVKARAGYISTYDQADFLNTMEMYALPPGINPIGASWRYFEIEGDSMEESLSAGDVILCSMVPHADWTELRNFYTYVIVTQTQILVKRIFMQSTEEWVLISDNETVYPQIKMSVEEVKELWVLRRLIKNKVPPPKQFEIKV